MGGDGQALGNKQSLLNKSKQYSCGVDNENHEKISEVEKRKDRWQNCSISLEPLEAPVVFDLGGIICSKISVVNFLLKKKQSEKENEVIDINKLSEVREVSNEWINGSFACPITGFLTSSGVHSFVGFWGCGHVVANAVFSTSKVASESRDDFPLAVCPVCSVSSLKVCLTPSSEKEVEQRAYHRQYLRSVRKRTRPIS